MEACLFSTTSSFTKAIEVLPKVRGKISRKFGSLISISCCLSNSSPQDESGPFITSDWRTFRAKLVAGERALEPEVHPHGPITDRWAHAIHEPEKGCLLIATEKLDGVHIFERTVVLLLSTGPVGPKGLILNRPSLMSIKEMRSAEVGLSGPFSGRPLFFGGPLEDGLCLVGPGGPSAGVFDEVMVGLYYGTKESVGCAAEMVKRGVVGPGEFRFYDGYCAWDMGQLRDEIRAGYWTVAACSRSVIGLTGEESVGLWEEIMGLVRPRKVW